MIKTGETDCQVMKGDSVGIWQFSLNESQTNQCVDSNILRIVQFKELPGRVSTRRFKVTDIKTGIRPRRSWISLGRNHLNGRTRGLLLDKLQNRQSAAMISVASRFVTYREDPVNCRAWCVCELKMRPTAEELVF